MLNWLRRIFIGCNHTYKPYGDMCEYFYTGRERPHKLTQSQRCTKCGNIKIMKV